MSILQEISRTLFKRHSRKIVMPGKRIARGSARRACPNRSRRAGQDYAYPVKKHIATTRQRPASIKSIANKQDVKAQTPFKTMINLASIFTGKHDPVIASILLTLKNNKLDVKATSLESWFSGTCKYKDDNINQPGQVCIDSMRIKRYVATVNGAVNIKLAGDGMHINNDFVPASCESTEFPLIPEPTKMGDRAYNITDIGQKLAFIAAALPKTGDYNASKGITGILFDINNKESKAVATDGKRMHITPMGREGCNPKYTGTNIIVPPKILKVAKVLSGQFMLQKREQRRNIIFGLNIPDCIAEVGGALIEHQYPGYTEVIPREFCGKCVVEKEELLTVLQRAIAVTTKEHPGARFEFSTKSVRISVVGEDCVSPLFRAFLAKGQYEGEVFMGTSNLQYLLDAVRNMPDTHIEIRLPKSRNGAWLVTGPLSKYMAVIMPINMGER